MRKTEYHVTRNGEFIGPNYPSRELAEKAIEFHKDCDKELERDGWIRLADNITYAIRKA